MSMRVQSAAVHTAREFDHDPTNIEYHGVIDPITQDGLSQMRLPVEINDTSLGRAVFDLDTLVRASDEEDERDYNRGLDRDFTNPATSTPAFWNLVEPIAWPGHDRGAECRAKLAALMAPEAKAVRDELRAAVRDLKVSESTLDTHRRYGALPAQVTRDVDALNLAQRRTQVAADNLHAIRWRLAANAMLLGGAAASPRVAGVARRAVDATVARVRPPRAPRVAPPFTGAYTRAWLKHFWEEGEVFLVGACMGAAGYATLAEWGAAVPHPGGAAMMVHRGPHR